MWIHDDDVCVCAMCEQHCIHQQSREATAAVIELFLLLYFFFERKNKEHVYFCREYEKEDKYWLKKESRKLK